MALFREDVEIIAICDIDPNSVGEALKQIKEKGYADAYRGQGKPIILLGVGFDETTKNVKTWLAEKIPVGSE